MSNLREWIKQELTVDVENELSKHKEKVKALLQLTPSGEILISRADLTAKHKIIAYMIGKVYAHVAKYSDDSTVTNKELIGALHMPEGTVKHNLHEFRNDGIITSKDGGHHIATEQIGVALDKYFGARPRARVSSLKKSRLTFKKTPAVKKEFTGLSGGLSKLYQEGFFDTPKLLKQILDEMERQAYYYSAPAVNTTLTRYFVKKNLLTRVGKRGQWKYVKKK